MKRFLLCILLITAFASVAFAQADPCDTAAKQKVVISQTASTKLISGVAGSRIVICHFHIVTTLANNVSAVEGTGSTCGTATAGMAGGTTAATGWNFGANGGINLGNGRGLVLDTATTGDDFCLLQSAATQVSGVVYYVRTVQ